MRTESDSLVAELRRSSLTSGHGRCKYTRMPGDANLEYTCPDFRSMALVTVDVQQDFLAGQPFEIPGTSEILSVLQTLAATFRLAQLPIIHMVRLYRGDGSNVELCRRARVEQGAAIVRPGTQGVELASVLVPHRDLKLDADLLLSGTPQSLGPMEWVMYKPRWGAFFETPLEQHLIHLGVTSLAFTGCNFPHCPRTSIYEASERDFRIVLVTDAVSGLYDRGNVEMKGIGVMLMTAKELAQEIV
jgi:nicotinamidase-related amidase